MKMKYIGGKNEFNKNADYYVDIVGFIPQSDILVSIRNKGNTSQTERRYCSLNSLLKNWTAAHS